MDKISENKRTKIRPIVYAVGFYISIMLIQTRTSSIGTILTLFAIFLIFSFFLIENHGKIKINYYVISILLFTILTVIGTLLRGYIAPNYYRMVAQLVTICFLSNIKLHNKEEERFLYIVFVASVFIYSIFVIRSCMTVARTYHGDIVLWNTPFDPNFIGLPFVACSACTLCLFLFGGNGAFKRVLLLVVYGLCGLTIMYTASRGSFVSFCVSNALVIVTFALSRKEYNLKKIIFAVIILALAIVIYKYITVNFSRSWERMMTVGQEGSDNHRLELWTDALKRWWDRPLFGNGLYSNYLVHHQATHNTYLEVLSETGLTGAVLIFGIFIKILNHCRKAGNMYLCMCVGLLVQILFLDTLDNRVVWIMLSWFIILPINSNKKKVATNG